MNVFQLLYAPKKARDAAEQDIPAGGVRLYGYLLFTNLGRMVVLNLLFVLFLLPVITIPAACAATSRVCMKLARKEPFLFWQEYWGEFKARFFSRLGVWILLMALPMAIACWARLLLGGELNSSLLAGLYALAFLVAGYFFPLCAMLDLPASVNMRNAAVLLALEWRRSLLLLLAGGGGFLLCALCFPYSLPILLSIAFSAAHLLAAMLINGPMERRLVASAV